MPYINASFLNAIQAMKNVRNSVRANALFFGCSREFARLYYQMATPSECIAIERMRNALITDSF